MKLIGPVHKVHSLKGGGGSAKVYGTRMERGWKLLLQEGNIIYLGQAGTMMKLCSDNVTNVTTYWYYVITTLSEHGASLSA